MDDLLLLARSVSTLHRNEQRYIGRIMHAKGLRTSGYLFVIYLSKQGKATQRHLCRILNMDEALATRTVRQLEKEGYLCKQKNPNDKRAVFLQLTSKGKELSSVLQKELSCFWGKATAQMSKDELESLFETLELLVKRTEELHEPRT